MEWQNCLIVFYLIQKHKKLPSYVRHRKKKRDFSSFFLFPFSFSFLKKPQDRKEALSLLLNSDWMYFFCLNFIRIGPVGKYFSMLIACLNLHFKSKMLRLSKYKIITITHFQSIKWWKNLVYTTHSFQKRNTNEILEALPKPSALHFPSPHAKYCLSWIVFIISHSCRLQCSYLYMFLNTKFFVFTDF